MSTPRAYGVSVTEQMAPVAAAKNRWLRDILDRVTQGDEAARQELAAWADAEIRERLARYGGA